MSYFFRTLILTITLFHIPGIVAQFPKCTRDLGTESNIDDCNELLADFRRDEPALPSKVVSKAEWAAETYFVEPNGFAGIRGMHFPPQKKARGNCELSLCLLDTRSGKITRKSIFILTEQLIDQCVKDRGMGGEFKIHGLGFRVSRPKRTRHVAATRSRAPVPSAESASGIWPRAASARPLLPPADVPAAIPQIPLLPPANPHWPRLPPVRLTAAEASQHFRSAVHRPGPTAAQDIPNEPPSPQDIPNESRSPSPAREHRAVTDSHPFSTFAEAAWPDLFVAQPPLPSDRRSPPAERRPPLAERHISRAGRCFPPANQHSSPDQHTESPLAPSTGSH